MPLLDLYRRIDLADRPEHLLFLPYPAAMLITSRRRSLAELLIIDVTIPYPRPSMRAVTLSQVLQ